MDRVRWADGHDTRRMDRWLPPGQMEFLKRASPIRQSDAAPAPGIPAGDKSFRTSREFLLCHARSPCRSPATAPRRAHPRPRFQSVKEGFPRIESVAVDEPALGRLLGYGTVIVRGTGGTPETFEKIYHPLEFREQVQRQIAGWAKPA